ncbi:MAG: FKBP-type peptidyl-prolyl cis-trans isomerase [Bacteroidota bacterium]
MEIKENRVVSLIYELRKDSESGEVLEKVVEENPLVFLYGMGNMLPKFEEKLAGLQAGDSFNFDLAAAEAYGQQNQDAIVNVPIAAFEVNGVVDQTMLKLGNTIPMQDNQGNRLNGKITEIANDHVRMDFNHPLAGENLHFNGRITEIREATEEELSHGHIHSGGCSGCGCGSGEQKDGCGC